MPEFFKYFPDMFEGSKLTQLEYLGPLFIGLVAIVFFYFIKDKISDKTKKAILYILAGLLVISEVTDKIYVYIHLGWHYDILSFHLCSISAIVGVYLVFFNQNRTLFGIWFFWSLQGALQALLAPTVTVGTEYYKYWQFFSHHVLLVVLPITILYFKNWIPDFQDVKRSYLWLIITCIPIIIFNTITGTEYMFVSLSHDARPSTGSILDLLGPFPYYILALFVLVFLLLYLTYLPIKIIYRKSKS